MLRISTKPQSDQERETRPGAASGIDPQERPEVGDHSQRGPKAWVDPLAGKNHAAQLVPWITNELRFHSVLDVASADGSAVKALRENGYEAHGIDLEAAEGQDGFLRGDAFDIPCEASYFDLAICANFVQDVENHRIPELFAELNRVSNSYVLIASPAGSDSERERTTAWWCSRVADFGWQIRLLRQDPDTRQTVILIEKPNSLASQVLPLLDAEEDAANVADPRSASSASVAADIDIPAPASNQAGQRPAIDPEPAIRLLDQAVATFELQDQDNAYLRISDMAHAIGPIGDAIDGLPSILDALVAAMEKRDSAQVVRILTNELRPALLNSRG